MKSKTRQDCENAVTSFSNIINNNLSSGNLLYVGIAGDPPGGEYSKFFNKFNIKTFDISQKWNPDILGDITKTNFVEDSWDVIVCVQTIEHIPNVWDLPNELKRILKTNGYAIIDCPWSYHYHGEPEFGDYWRISKDGLKVLFSNFNIVELITTDNNTSILVKK